MHGRELFGCGPASKGRIDRSLDTARNATNQGRGTLFDGGGLGDLGIERREEISNRHGASLFGVVGRFGRNQIVRGAFEFGDERHDPGIIAIGVAHDGAERREIIQGHLKANDGLHEGAASLNRIAEQVNAFPVNSLDSRLTYRLDSQAMKEVDPIIALEKFRKRFRTQAEAAKSLEVTSSFLGDMLKKHRAIPPSVLEQLGLRRAIVQDKEPA